MNTGINMAGTFDLPVTTVPTLTITAPFTANGFVSGSGNGVSFSVDFTGSGLATLQLVRYMDTNQYFFQSATYTFQTPEPESLILFGSAVTSLLLIGYRKKNWPRLRP